MDSLDDLADIVAGCAVCSGYPLVSSKLAKMLGFKGYLPLPLSPTPRSKPELGQPLLSRERAKLRGRGKTEKWDSPKVSCRLLIFAHVIQLQQNAL